MKNLRGHIRNFYKTRFLLLAVLLLSCGCTSCLKAPVLCGADAIYFGTVSDSNLRAVIRLKVYNPNAGDTKLKDAHVKIYYESKLISNSELDSPIVRSGRWHRPTCRDVDVHR